MSQLLEPTIGKDETILFQDLYFVKKRTSVESTVIEATCTFCNSGLNEGVSVTARKIGHKVRFFCQYHLP